MAGSLAALAAELVQLPLHSPNDSFFNAGSVMVGSLIAGVLLGRVWGSLLSGNNRWVVFGGICLAAFVAVTAAAVAGQTLLERVVSFVVPLAAIVLGAVGVLIPSLSGSRIASSRLLMVALLALAIGLGVALAGQGDAPSGHLDIPPRSGS